MSLNVKASQAYFRKLRCAYTDRPITVLVVAHATAKEPLYFSPDAFDPSDFQASGPELFAMLGTRQGVRGAARGGAELTCPYTGKRMMPHTVAGLGVQAVGGFSPRTPSADPVEFARLLMSRGGVVPASAPKHTPPPVVRANDEPEIPDSAPVVSTDAAMEAADKLLAKAAPPKVMITVPGMGG